MNWKWVLMNFFLWAMKVSCTYEIRKFYKLQPEFVIYFVPNTLLGIQLKKFF